MHESFGSDFLPSACNERKRIVPKISGGESLSKERKAAPDGVEFELARTRHDRLIYKHQLRRQLLNSLDPYQRAIFYQAIKPRPRKRLERALIRLLVIFDRVDEIVADSESARR